jgi:hypothetical protein
VSEMGESASREIKSSSVKPGYKRTVKFAR